MLDTARFISALAASLLAVLVSITASAAPARIKLATLAPKGTSFHHVLLAMGEKWRSAPGGGALLTVYTDGAMGGEADAVRRMRVGQIQAAMLTATGLAEIDESIAALQNMPMVFRSLDEVDHVRLKLRPLLEHRYRDKGFVLLFTGDGGWAGFFSCKPLLAPDDLKQMKLFAWSGDNKAIDLWKAAGYRPVPLEMTDILTGLQTGLIDAVCSPPSYALSGQFFAPAPHMLDLHWAPLIGGTVISRKTWDALPPSAQEAMLKAAAEAGQQIQAKSRQESVECIAAMKKRGLIVHEATPQIEAAWRKLAEDAYPKIRSTIVPTDLFDQVQQILKEYRSSAGPGKP
jgi:TRAP-type C4-dicarboxylate transport system substrate-binding protein